MAFTTVVVPGPRPRGHSDRQRQDVSAALVVTMLVAAVCRKWKVSTRRQSPGPRPQREGADPRSDMLGAAPGMEQHEGRRSRRTRVQPIRTSVVASRAPHIA